MPAVASCYQVHAQNADTHITICGGYATLSATVRLVPKPRCCLPHRTLKSPYPIYAAYGHYTCDNSCIALLLIHHIHKVFVSYHKKGRVCWQMLYLKNSCFVVRVVWRK